MVIIDEVERMQARGWTIETMMRRLGVQRKTVTEALWRLQNRAYCAKIQREFGKRRYSTDAYRAWNRERERRQYHQRKMY